MNGKEKQYYIQRCLIKVTDPDKYLYGKEVSYWAVDEDTADSMLNSGYDMTTNPSLQKIKMHLLGYVQIQCFDYQPMR